MCYGVKLVISQNNESPAATNRSMRLAPPYNDIPVQEDGRDVIGQLDLAQACRMDVRQILQPILPT